MSSFKRRNLHDRTDFTKNIRSECSHLTYNFPSLVPQCCPRLALWYSDISYRFLHCLRPTHFLIAFLMSGVLKSQHLCWTHGCLLRYWYKLKMQKPLSWIAMQTNGHSVSATHTKLPQLLQSKWSGAGTDCPGKCWVTIPAGVQKTCRCGTSGYGLVGMVLLGW